MPVEPYPTKVIDGLEHWGIPCWVPKAHDPDRGVFIYFAKPVDGIAGISGLVQGDPGKHTIITPEVVITEVLDYDDPIPDAAEFVVITPGSDTVSQVVQLHKTERRGQDGDDGNTILDPADFTSPAAGLIPAVNAGVDGFELVQQKAGRLHWAAALSNAPGGTAATFTIGQIVVGANVYKAPWRPDIDAAVTVLGSTADIGVDLVARLGAADGPIVGRGTAVGGVQAQRVTLQSGPPAGTSAADADFYVAAGAAATIYLVAEKVSGSATYSTVAPWFSMRPAWV